VPSDLGPAADRPKLPAGITVMDVPDLRAALRLLELAPAAPPRDFTSPHP